MQHDFAKTLRKLPPFSPVLALQAPPLLRYPEKPICEEGEADVEQNKQPQDAEIAPALIVVHVEESKVLIGVAVRAKLATSRTFSAWLEVTAQYFDVWSKVGGAVLYRQCIESEELVCCTHEIRVCNRCREHASYQVGQW